MTRILVVYRHPPELPMRPAVRAHLHAVTTAAAGDPSVSLTFHNSYLERPSALLQRLEFDAVILHTTFLCMRWSDRFGEFAWTYSWLADTGTARVALPQDDYDHAEVLDEWLADLGVTDIFSALADHADRLYPTSNAGATVHGCLTGYIDEQMAGYAQSRIRPAAERQLDLVYRATHLPYWFGSHGQLKHEIGERALVRARVLGLSADISTQDADTLYGNAWTEFLLSGRAVVGVESGSSVLDRRGEIQAAVGLLLSESPAATFADVSSALPHGWDDTRLAALSPRHLEAVVSRTAQVLVEGSYNGVLEPERHYLPIARDFSNLDDVLATVRDHGAIDALTERAYAEIYESGRYSRRRFGERVLAAAARGHSTRVFRRAAFPAVAATDRAAASAARRTRSTRQRAEHHLVSSLLLHPRAATRLGFLSLRAPAEIPRLRQLLAAWAVRRRSRGLDARTLSGDLVRLSLLLRTLDQERRGVAKTRTTFSESSEIVARTVEADPACDRTPRLLALPTSSVLVWDYSAVGTAVPLGSGGTALALGNGGVYRFDALARLLREDS